MFNSPVYIYTLNRLIGNFTSYIYHLINIWLVISSRGVDLFDRI